MAMTAGQMVPTVLVLAMGGYCCWPYLGGESRRAGTEAAGKLPELTAALLSPSIDPTPDRDPFRAAPAIQPDAIGIAAKSIEPDAIGSAAAPSEDSEAAEGSSAEPETASPANLSVLTLNATFLRGSRRLAMINSQLYAQGEPLAQGESSAAPYVVSEVYPDKVMLERQGQTVELNYADTGSKSDPVPRPKAAGQGPSPRAAKGATKASTPRDATPPSHGTKTTKPTKASNAKP